MHDDLGLSELSARWVPKALRPDQLVLRSNMSLATLNEIEVDEEQFLNRIITEDEICIYQYDPETKLQSKQWLPRGSSGPFKFKSEKPAQKMMAAIF